MPAVPKFKSIVKPKKTGNEYYDIVIDKGGNIFIQPFGEAVEFLTKKLRVDKKGRKLSIFCG